MYDLQGDKIDRRVCITWSSQGIFLLQQGFFFVLGFADWFFNCLFGVTFYSHSYVSAFSLCHRWLFSLPPWDIAVVSLRTIAVRSRSSVLPLPLGMLALSGISWFWFFLFSFHKLASLFLFENISKEVKFRETDFFFF